ncbi:MAG: BamA/TamA family outer membrane protein [Flavobacteriales bacterium]
MKTDVSISYFIPIWKKATVLTRIQSGNIFGDNLFVNELYQIGGLKTLRGFNQQSIFASNYAIGTAEFRYLFERNSAIFAYFDYGFYENKSINDFATDTPFGFGVGTNFQTKAGIFSLTYGLGQQKGNPLLIRNGKVHFGFVSLF